MRFRAPISIVLATLVVSFSQSAPTAWADEARSNPYSLEEIMALAVGRSPMLAEAQGAMKESRGQQIAAGAYPNPILEGGAGKGSIRDPSTGVSIIEHTITVGQPIEWSPKRQARQEAANAGVAGASAGLEAAKLNLLTDVKVGFYQLLLAQRDAELAAQNVATVEEVLRTAKLRVAAGEATSFDTMKAGVELQKAQKEAARARNGLLVARSRLNTLTAGGLGKQFSIVGGFQPLKQELNVDQLVTEAVERHPALRRLSKLAEQAERTVEFERESRIPNINVLGTYHREAGDQSIIAGLAVPIPIWYRRQGEIETALGAKHRAVAERQRAQNELEQAVIQHSQDVRTAQEQLRVFETGLLKQAEQILTIARTSFRQGAASLLDLLDAQRVYRQTLYEYAQVSADLSIALVRLERDLGAPL
ncbi:MAG: TolC family protein [Nitrospira sp.]|nr:TolC family protein [Nitrospira sp.]